MTKLITQLATALHQAGQYNRDDKVQPAAVLWLDPDRLWEPLMSALRERLPILTLGEYDPRERKGPAIWIRCELAASMQDGQTVVVYLPGVDRTDLRAVESCPDGLRPIAELQFRATWWLQSNQAPWTPAAFLRSKDALGLDLARDDATRLALQSALPKLAEAEVEDLRRVSTIDSSFLYSLLVRDETKTLLSWLSDPAGTKADLTPEEWSAFVAKSRGIYGLDPEEAGQVSVAEALGGRKGKWRAVWERYTEAPHTYPGIPNQLRKARPGSLFSDHPDSWPQDNEEAEARLQSDMASLGDVDGAQARARVRALESEHGERRSWVWATLGQAPLAAALAKVQELADLTAAFPAGTLGEFTTWYTTDGWRADAAAVAALRLVQEPVSRDAVGRAVRALYLPWLDESARRFQNLITSGGDIGQTGLDVRDGECVLFVDGLRFDVGQSLRTELSERGATVESRVRVAPFPTMTSTCKPAIAPLTRQLTGGAEFNVEAGGKTVDAATLRLLLAEEGVACIPPGDHGDPTGRGWTESADLDATGHKLGLKLVDRIPAEVAEIASRTRELLDAGWQKIHVVTDHGWLLMPGTLPKVELAQHLTISRKSRCARLSPAVAQVDQPTVGWTWDRSVRMTCGHGIAAFAQGCTYEHGGLSPQESLIPHLIVTRSSSVAAARIESIKWQGMRCRVDVVDSPSGANVDLRRQPGNPQSSLIKAPVSAEGEMDVKVLAQDPDSTGEVVFVVLVSDLGEILAQVETRVGGMV